MNWKLKTVCGMEVGGQENPKEGGTGNSEYALLGYCYLQQATTCEYPALIMAK